MKLYDSGVYLVNGNELVPDGANAIEEVKGKTGAAVTKEQAAENTIAYGILKNHNTSGNMEKLQIKFDKLTSHDITFVGIIGIREVPDSVCVDQLSQQPLCSRRNDQRG